MTRRVPLLKDRPRPLIFAHRGCSSLAPENTMASFRLARQYEAPGIELDIHRCASGELVVCHDANTQRTTGVTSIIEERSWDELSHLDAGAPYSPAFTGERLPLLTDVLDEFGSKLYIDIELKTRLLTNDPLPRTLAAALRDHPQAKPEGIVVSSFNPSAIAAFKLFAPEYATAIIWSGDAGVPCYLRRGQGRWLSGCDYLKPDAAQAKRFAEAALNRKGRPVVPWTIDDSASAQRLLQSGCEGIITNRPQDLVPLLSGR